MTQSGDDRSEFQHEIPYVAQCRSRGVKLCSPEFSDAGVAEGCSTLFIAAREATSLGITAMAHKSIMGKTGAFLLVGFE
jgi:hypothetical protein